MATTPEESLEDVTDVPVPAEGEETFVTRREVERARRVKALQWRMMGLTYSDIAERLEMSVNSVARMVDSALSGAENAVSESVQQMRALENRRLERLHATFWPSALKGDDKAFSNIMKLHDRRVRLNGLEAPTQVNLTLAVRTEMEEALKALEDVLDAEVVEDSDNGTPRELG